ncbi:RNA-directed DNA polymerase [Photobacterium angustum]|uniref:Reverse transcriptase domain-containing protein n=1 Tax=Photobacterium angustum (strain S14 / CCUG 15956) TaxID=314292 RepID=Q1ZP92_PHOAS|nr:RNA-directed DNA polymerase [Photobacterium angustum]EAS64068.1 hypothetical protein VAS14_17481 [Photobacterium angustum S14]
MKLLDKKYYNLEPNAENLKDSFILGLAWKKTDSFIRNYNWYANLLELDRCTFNISDEVLSWSNTIKNEGYIKGYIELIPAPKSARWFVKEGKWTQEKKEHRLRPLADISIREQTFATAVTMCIADSLETKQRDCSMNNSDYSEHIKNKVYNYGNRLLCDWESDNARFRWGGSEFYRKFSTDYKNFLQRPISIGREIHQKVSEIDDVFIVSLDLTNFYGCIKKDLLIRKLKEIASEHHDIEYGETDEFWELIKNILDWEWSEESLSLLKKLNITTSDITGLPQGLASAGALANAYLVKFDEKLGTKLNTKINDSTIMLHDYCRYVDDIRLVISGESLSSKDIKRSVRFFIQGILNETLEQKWDGVSSKPEQYLEVNDDKTNILPLSELDNASSLANRVNEIQKEIGASSVPERNGLDNNIPALQQLLLTQEDDPLGDTESLFPGLNCDKSIKIESVRSFSAHRLETSLIKKSKLISPDETIQFENESILVAKHLVEAWLKDPSVMVIFRKALAIKPAYFSYSTILNIIFERVKKNRDKFDKYIMIYLLSDIFRSVVDIYRSLRKDQLSDYQKLIGEVSVVAQKLLTCRLLPSYAYQQAHFFLAVVNKPYMTNSKSTSAITKLRSVLVKKNLDSLESSDGYLFELSAQISNEYKSNAAFLLSHSEQKNTVDSIIEKFAFRGGLFWNSIWDELVRTQDKVRIDKFRWAIPKQTSRPNGNEHYLSTVISFEDNPFKFEHALLKLGIALVESIDGKNKTSWNNVGNQRSPHEIKIKLTAGSWSKLWRPDSTISCELDAKESKSKDPRYLSPKWLANKSLGSFDEQKIYWICSILRSAALGNLDFTQRNDLSFDSTKYSGIRSQWYKRSIGMLHKPESIVGPYATISDWFANLIQHGLQWPGFSSSYLEEKDILAIENLNGFRSCLNERLTELNRLICTSSDVPTIPTVVRRPELSSNLFRIVTVQQLFPKDNHFTASDPELNHPEIRWKHRDHLAEVCKLTEQTLSAKLRAESKQQKSTADLIVFSELAVHPNDEDILRSLAFRTKAIIFAGFVFTDHNGNTVNKARWIIPDSSESGVQWRIRDQGKYHMTLSELNLNIKGYRPVQHLVSIEGNSEGPFKLTGAICYDATDIKLAADLRDLTDMFVISAYNQDVNTFDNMASALQWHMFQHIVIANTGEYGGSTMQAPYKERHNKLISHAHGTKQIAISTADIDLAAFRRKVKKYKATKTQPAGFARNH